MTELAGAPAAHECACDHLAHGRKQMLVISRRKDDSLMIGDSIEVSIVEIRGDKVRIGVTCPKEMSVHRREVYEAICRDSSSWQSLAGSTSPSATTAVVAAQPATDSLVTAGPATLVLSGDHVARLDKLRAAGGISRETAVETLLQVVDQAGVTSLCDLERRLRR
jgi:carbon storage regulator